MFSFSFFLLSRKIWWQVSTGHTFIDAIGINSLFWRQDTYNTKQRHVGLSFFFFFQLDHSEGTWRSEEGAHKDYSDARSRCCYGSISQGAPKETYIPAGPASDLYVKYIATLTRYGKENQKDTV